MRLISVFLWTLLLSKPSLAQHIFEGKIIDKEGNGVPFASIHRNQGNGVLTNQFGEFQFQSSSSEEKIRITHVSYNDTTRFVQANQQIKIQLKDLIKVLPEATVSLRGQKIMLALYEKLKNENITYSATGFYRQMTQMDGILTDILESYHTVFAKTNTCIEKYKLINGRYGEYKPEGPKPAQFTNLKNMVFVSKFLMQSDIVSENKIFYPLMPNLKDHYIFSIQEEYKNNLDEIIVKVNCEPIRKEGAFRGTFTINTNKNILLKYEGTILGLGTVENTENTPHKWSNIDFYWETYFNPLSGFIELIHLKAETRVEYKKYNVSKEFTFDGVLFLTNQIESEKVSGKKPSHKTDDYKEIKKAKYDPEFWRMNNPIKYSFEENKSIDQYEKGKFFGNYFEQENN
jgi:hypothetical protein